MGSTGQCVHLGGKGRFLRANTLPDEAAIGIEWTIRTEIKAPFLGGQFLMTFQIRIEGIAALIEKRIMYL